MLERETTTQGLPPELWMPIIQSLPPLDRLSFMSVSRLLHEIAVPLVFEHVQIAYGLSSDCKRLSRALNPHEPPPVGSSKTQEQRARAARSTSEFLQYIAATPELARVVKRLTVRAISLSPKSVDCADLVNALRALINLQSFSWRGTSPCIPESAIDAIIQSGAPLTKLVIPLWNPAVNALVRLRNTQSICLDGDLRIVTGSERIRKAPSRENPSVIIQANAETLRSLSVYGAVSRWRVPIKSLANLTEFECIWPDGNWAFLASMLDQCAHLRTLMLGVGPVDLMEGAIVPVLRARASALPQLTSFKIAVTGSGRPSMVALVDALVLFLANKTSLRRLDVNIYGIDEGIPGLDQVGCPLVHVLELLPSFPHLEVLGFNLSRFQLTKHDLALLDRSIPLGLTALFLNLEIRTVGRGVRPVLFADLFKKREQLRYLHVVDSSRKWVFFDALQSMCPRTVELLGSNQEMYWTVPSAAGPGCGVELASGWSDMQLWFHTVDDFAGQEDWEWLVRHRNADITP